MTEQNTPELRFPEFKEEWNKKVLNEVLTVNSGKDYKHLNLGEYPVYGTGGYMLSVDSYLSDNDSIGIGRKGTINKPYLLKAPFWTVDTLFFCTPKEGFNISFLLNLFFTINWKKYDESTGVPSLSKITINKIVSSFPNKIEQNKIGNFFSKLDRQIELEEEKLKRYKYQIRGYIQAIFSKKLRFKDGMGNDYPEWSLKKIEDISSVTKGFTPNTKDDDNWNEEERNWLSIAGMTQKYLFNGNKGITQKGALKHSKVEQNTLIMSFKLTLGKLAIVKAPMYTNEAICHFKWKNNNIDTEYMYYYLNSINIKTFGAQAVKGITLNNDSINSITVQLPNIEEQKKISSFLTKFEEMIEKQSTKVELFKQRKQGLLQKMFV